MKKFKSKLRIVDVASKIMGSKASIIQKVANHEYWNYVGYGMPTNPLRSSVPEKVPSEGRLRTSAMHFSL